jgi:hypothetical protein
MSEKITIEDLLATESEALGRIAKTLTGEATTPSMGHYSHASGHHSGGGHNSTTGRTASGREAPHAADARLEVADQKRDSGSDVS